MSRDIALAYARAGYSVIAIHTVRYDDDDMANYCTCGNFDCRSPGKHPIAEISPSGARSATNDPDVVANWPDQPMNVGVAGGKEFPDGGFLCLIDIDDDETAAKLKEAPELRDMLGVVHTGRENGLHFHVLTPEVTPSGILHSPNGLKLGEVRSDGQYCVVPPSTHYSGRQYEWVGPSVFEAGLPHSEGDGWAYAAKLLGLGSVEIAERNQYKEIPAFVGTIDPTGAIKKLGFKVSTLITAAMEPGWYLQSNDGKQDRSDTLYWLACQIWREADLSGNTIAVTPEQVAAVVKAKDAAWTQPKWLNRPNSTSYYWECANRTREVVSRDTQTAIAGLVISNGWGWDEAANAFGPIVANGNIGNAIANFETKIIERLIPWDGEDASTPEDWIIKSRQGTEERIYRVEAEKRSEPGRFMKEVELATPSHWVVPSPEARKKYMMAVQAYSGSAPLRRAYMATGWLPDRDAFLLPIGAITKDGLIDVPYEPHNAPKRMQQYGVGMRPAEDGELEHYLRLLFTMADPPIIIPMLIQTFASSLETLGMGKAVSVVHLLGRTGSFKTSLARVAMSVFGRFAVQQEDPIDPWSSTPKGLGVMFYYPRDLPLLVDDYKFTRPRDDLTALLQNYADRTGRAAAQRDGSIRESPVARCLLLSTGENVWSGNESTLARTIVVDVEQEKINLSIMTTAQKVAANKNMAVVGFEWLRWLATKGKSTIALAFEHHLAEVQAEVREEEDTIHRRMRMSSDGLRTSTRLVGKWIKALAPGFYEEFDAIQKEGWRVASQRLRQEAEEAADFNPWNQLVDEIREAIARGDAYLAGRVQGVNAVGRTIGDCVGYIDNTHVCLNEKTSYGWFLRSMKAKGVEVTHIWRMFVQEAKTHHLAEQPSFAIPTLGGARTRVLKIPISEFFPDGIERTVYDFESA